MCMEMFLLRTNPAICECLINSLKKHIRHTGLLHVFMSFMGCRMQEPGEQEPKPCDCYDSGIRVRLAPVYARASAMPPPASLPLFRYISPFLPSPFCMVLP